MAKITRFNGNLLAFGINATGTNRTVFGDVIQSDALDDNLNTDYFLGWEIVGVNENPTREDFNALGFTHGQILAYLHQMGVPEWNTNQEYHIGSFASVAGALYESQTNSNTGNDPTADSATNWLPLKDNRVTVATITPASDANVTLTRDEYSAEVLVLTDGAWTAARSIIVPNAPRLYHVDNSAGTHTATIKTAAGSGVAVVSGDTLILYCDGTNVVDAITRVISAINADNADLLDGVQGATLLIGGGISAGAYDFNNVAQDAVIPIGFSRIHTNVGSPFSWGHGFTLKSGVSRAFQIFFNDTGNSQVYFRNQSADGAAWEAWRLIFNQANILGTVSQSGGVPTGAIIERGSNANGEYVRFADGTQICTTSNAGSLDVNTADGAIYMSSSTGSWTYPAAFVGFVPTLSFQVINGNRWVSIIGTPSITGASYVQHAATQDVSVSGTRGLAIGRWF